MIYCARLGHGTGAREKGTSRPPHRCPKTPMATSATLNATSACSAVTFRMNFPDGGRAPVQPFPESGAGAGRAPCPRAAGPGHQVARGVLAPMSSLDLPGSLPPPTVRVSSPFASEREAHLTDILA